MAASRPLALTVLEEYRLVAGISRYSLAVKADESEDPTRQGFDPRFGPPGGTSGASELVEESGWLGQGRGGSLLSGSHGCSLLDSIPLFRGQMCRKWFEAVKQKSTNRGENVLDGLRTR